jgi:hypothetical protein
MLLRTLLLVAFIATLSETMVQGAAALARISLHERALDAARTGFAGAVARAQQWLAATIAARQSPASAAVPAPIATCVLSAPDGCRMQLVAAFQAPAPAASAPGACPSSNCTTYLQANADVAESRFSLDVSSSVIGASGTALATRNATVIFRTFQTPPYATLAGALDASIGAIAPGGSGDDGGLANGSGTLVNVEYVQQGTSGASPFPGNVWQAVQQHPAAAAQPWNP